MQPIAFKVEMYKGVIDSGWIDLQDLTVIVGKNEAGKTTLLKALHKFKPFRDEPYVINREWPRGHRRDQKTNQIACTVRFALDEDEREAISEHTDEEFVAATIDLARTYSGHYWLLGPEAFPDRPPLDNISAAFDELPPLPDEAGDGYQSAVDAARAEVREKAVAGLFTNLATEVKQRRPLLLAAMTDETRAVEDPHATAFLAKLAEIVTTLSNQPTIRRKCTELVTKWVPTFIYMDDYRSFQGSVLLSQLQQRKSQGQLTQEDKTVLMLMELSGLKLDDVIAKSAPDRIEDRTYDLSDAGRSLTNDISSRWTQRSYEVDFRADGDKFMTFVKDENDPSLIPLEDRSKGFQWFFSFDLMLAHETRGTFAGAVLLLDEPGLHLHPEAQRDLVKRLEQYAKENTVLYTTHLPFMIDLRHPARIRVINEDQGKGTTVSSDLTGSQKEAKFVLQAALGMSGSQSHLLSQQNLVVEGVDDYWVLTELSNLLIRSGEPGLPDELFITPAGGASEAAYIATFMIGQKLDVVVLLDSDSAGGDAHDKLVKTWLARYQDAKAEVLMLGPAAGATATEFATEDLFTDDFFAGVVAEVYHKELQLAGAALPLTLERGGLVWKRASRTLEKYGITYGSGQKGRVAKALRASISKAATISDLPEATQAMARQLMKSIRSAVLGPEALEVGDKRPSEAPKAAAKPKAARKPK
jgi:energy-coupling factor transporter ATP-binding protein EcfA2